MGGKHKIVGVSGRARGCGLAAAVAAFLILESAAALAGPAITPHLAVYRLGLDSSHGASGVAQASGRIEFEWAEGCDGWTINQRAQLVITDLQGNDFESGWILKAWESTDGLSYRFSVQSAQGGGTPEEIRGRGTLHGPGKGGSVRFSTPSRSALVLPEGTLFPTQYGWRLLDAAVNKELLMWRYMFDGTGEEGLYGVNAALLQSLPGGTQPSFDSPLLAGIESWRVQLSFFGTDEANSEPEHEQTQRMYANGVVDELVMAYDDLSLRASLERLEAVPKPDCP
jgi:hypothetical protein